MFLFTFKLSLKDVFVLLYIYTKKKKMYLHKKYLKKI